VPFLLFLRDVRYQRAADEVEAVANESSLTVAAAHRHTGLHLLYSTAARHLTRSTGAAWWKWARMASEIAHRSRLAEVQAALEALTKEKEQLEVDLKTATLASTAAREEVSVCCVETKRRALYKLFMYLSMLTALMYVLLNRRILPCRYASTPFTPTRSTHAHVLLL